LVRIYIFTQSSIKSYLNQLNYIYYINMSVDLNKTVKRLEAYKDSPSPIISIYFQFPIPKRVRNETIVNKFQYLINANLTYEQREEIRRNIQFIVGFMENYQQAHGEKSIAFFSGGNNLFEVLHLPFKTKNFVTYSHSPDISQILEHLEDKRRFLVILSERKKAIFYTIYSGALEDQTIITNNNIPQDVKGNWPESPRADRHDKVQRHVRVHTIQYFKNIAKKAEEFIQNKSLSGVIIGGHKSEISQFEKYLPKHLKDKVVGEFVSSLKTNFNDILARSMNVISNVNKNYNKEGSYY
jgi:hypothetical protein